jgi:Holliday junction resolvase RusA-like endonuclease
MIKIIIEGNPFTVNKQYCTRKGSRKIMLSREAQGYGDNIAWQAKKQFMKLSRTPLKENLEVTYYYYFPTKNKKIDHLNYNKLLNDRFNQIVWDDDRQIKISHHYTMFDSANPRTEILIKII